MSRRPSSRRLAGSGIVVAAVLLGLGAQIAGASTYGGPPQPGAWIARSNGYGHGTFRVTDGGRSISKVVLRVRYTCRHGSSKAPGGTLVLRHPRPIPIDPYFGELKDTIFRAKGPRAKHATSFQLQGDFTAHHEIPPPARSGEIELTSGAMVERNGDSCLLGSGHEGSSDVRFTARPRH